jgi:ABC-type multidrug transport system fused ATPase/permease subunit
LYELESGSIRVDGIDIANVALDTLRSRLAMISQDAILFSETLRFNVDPFHEKTDKEVWDALKAVQLSQLVESGGGLEMAIEERGANLSQGLKHR